MVKAGKRVLDQASEDGFELAIPKRPKTSTMHRKISTSMEDIPDSAEDPGHKMGQKLSASMKKNEAKSLVIVANFKDLIERRKQELMRSLDGKMSQITKKDDDLQAETTSILSEVLLFQQEQPTKERTIAATESGCQSIHQSAMTLISASKELQKQYNNICQQVTSTENKIKLDGGWEADCGRLQNLLVRQNKKVKRDIHVMLHGKQMTSRGEPGDDLPIEEDELWTRFAVDSSMEESKATRAKTSEDWVATATNAERGVRRLVNHLPEHMIED